MTNLGDDAKLLGAPLFSQEQPSAIHSYADLIGNGGQKLNVLVGELSVAMGYCEQCPQYLSL